MGVEALWSSLDEARCGELIGASELRKQHKRLAVDLSIWICEAMASTALRLHHANPALHLVYHRAVKLLKIGIIPIFVLEGRSRRNMDETGLMKKRHKGDYFWKACEKCREMLELLGVPVVQASVEGEALCALLNSRGIVDGVITKDGDALLYGATVVITNFSVENLEKSQLKRYKSCSLRALADNNQEADDSVISLENDEFSVQDSVIFYTTKRYMPLNAESCIPTGKQFIELSRDDLICFALLTGSDLTGGGVETVGRRKALRFIHGCKMRSAAESETSAALNEIEKWANSGPFEEFDSGCDKNCSVCFHPGDCRDHRKNGCNLCGNGPGQYCNKGLPDEKFRRALQRKIRQLPQSMIIDAIKSYKTPNDLEVPEDINLNVQQPKYEEFFTSKLVINGRGKGPSRAFLANSLPKLIVRLELIRCNLEDDAKNFKYKPIKILKEIIHRGHECYEVLWTPEDFDIDDGICFKTREWRQLIRQRFSSICKAFDLDQRRLEQSKNQEYRNRLFFRLEDDAQKIEGKSRRRNKVRKFFVQSKNPENSRGNKSRNQKRDAKDIGGDDIEALMRFSHDAPSIENNQPIVEDTRPVNEIIISICDPDNLSKDMDQLIEEKHHHRQSKRSETVNDKKIWPLESQLLNRAPRRKRKRVKTCTGLELLNAMGVINFMKTSSGARQELGTVKCNLNMVFGSATQGRKKQVYRYILREGTENVLRSTSSSTLISEAESATIYISPGMWAFSDL